MHRGLNRYDTPPGPRRFYGAVDVAPAEDGFELRLDGRVPKSPTGAALRLPTPDLAALVAEEWDAQVEHLIPATMPATRLAWTAIDSIPAARADYAAELASFAATDLVCYFAETPAELVRRQEEAWGPLLAWAEASLGVNLLRATGISHQRQPPGALERVRVLALACDDFTLAGLCYGAGLFGSAILALAVQRGRLNGAGAIDLSRLDERFQEEKWGVDAEAEIATAALTGNAIMLERWFAALPA